MDDSCAAAVLAPEPKVGIRVPLPIVPPQSQILAQINEHVEQAFHGGMSPKEALDAAATASQGILDEYWSGKQ